MAGIFDKISAALSPAQGDGHTTSGIDSAMQAQANKLHPTGSGAGVQQKTSAPVATKFRKDGSVILMGDSDYGQ